MNCVNKLSLTYVSTVDVDLPNNGIFCQLPPNFKFCCLLGFWKHIPSWRPSLEKRIIPRVGNPENIQNFRVFHTMCHGIFTTRSKYIDTPQKQKKSGASSWNLTMVVWQWLELWVSCASMKLLDRCRFWKMWYYRMMGRSWRRLNTTGLLTTKPFWKPGESRSDKSLKKGSQYPSR